jgi:3-dehydroquinate synthase
MIESLTVQLGARAYPIHFPADLGSTLGREIESWRAAGRRVVLVTDEHVATRQAGVLAALANDAPVHQVPAGEGSKSLAELGRLLDFLAASRLDRSGVVIAFGGGVVGDLAGFAAASYLRGVDLVQVPTTLLAMVDSSVGGKTGINLAAGKNLVGAFHQARAVYVATALLATLPAREFAAGMAEVIKYGLIGDAGLWADLQRTPLSPGDERLPAVGRRCCAAKARVVEADEFETAASGGRALLNLGHTFGHAIEQVTGYGVYLHGEAVAIGLVAAARLAARLDLAAAELVGQVEAVLAAHGLPTRLSEPLPRAELLAAMARDKKVRAGRLRFVISPRPGEAVTLDYVDPALADEIFATLGAV